MDEELTCSTLVGNKIVIGSERGVLRVRNTDNFQEPAENIPITGAEGVEAVCAIPDTLNVGDGGIKVITGMGNGSMGIVQLRKGKSKILREFSHDPIDAPESLGFVKVDGTERLVSGGGKVVKIWEEQKGAVNGLIDLARESDDVDSDDSDDADGQEESSDEDEKPQKRRKKKRRGKGKGKHSDHGVMAFKGMD